MKMRGEGPKTLARKAIVLAFAAFGLLFGTLGCGQQTSASADFPDFQAQRVYSAAMNAWFKTYRTDIQDEVASITFTDPMAPTNEEIERVRQFAAIEHASFVDLQSIVAPAEIAEAHAKYIESERQAIEALDLWVSILESGDWSQMDACQRMSLQSRNLQSEALQLLDPYINDPALSTP
jgi:hypothetical protein